jgi:hypothetical protein
LIFFSSFFVALLRRAGWFVLGITLPHAALAENFSVQQDKLNARTARMNARYIAAQRECYARFWMNHCLNKAHIEMRDEKAEIRKAQLALSARKRAERARQRLQRLPSQQRKGSAS